MRSGRVRVLPHGMMDVLRQGNLGALVLPLVLLAAGGTARALLARKTVAYNWHGVTLAKPAGWTVAESSGESADGDSVVLMDLLGPGRIKPRVTLRVGPLPASSAEPAAAPDSDDAPPPPAAAPNGAGDEPAASAAPDPGASAPAVPVIAPAIAETLSNRLPLYYVMNAQETTISGAPATRVESAFAFTPRAIPGRKGDIPVVMRAIDLIVLRASDALSVQVAAPIEDFEAQRPTLEAIMASLRVETTPGEPLRLAPPAASPEPGDEDATALTHPPAVTVAGQVVDADSGLPVPGAIVLFLTPGTAVDDVTDDNLPDSTYTSGLADSTGHFASNRALTRASRYPVMVVADGYHWIGSEDGVSVEGETPARLDVGAVRLRRR